MRVVLSVFYMLFVIFFLTFVVFLKKISTFAKLNGMNGRPFGASQLTWRTNSILYKYIHSLWYKIYTF